MTQASQPWIHAIDGDTKLMGLIGGHISYTLSPLMHNRAANLLKQNVAYLPLSLPKDKIKIFLEAAWHMDSVGFNVTQPHKSFVASLVGGDQIRSVNTLYRGQEGWIGCSTDGMGFQRAIERLGRSLGSFGLVVILGAGGVVTSILEHLVVMSLQGQKIPEMISIMRRSFERDSDLRAAAQGVLNLELSEMTTEALSKRLLGAGSETLLVQATSAPLHGDKLSEFAVALEQFQGVVADLVYGRPSDIYYRALAKDLVAMDGESMLIEQARLSQELWWGRSASYDSMALAIRGK